MEIQQSLVREFEKQVFGNDDDIVTRYKHIAESYVATEKVIAVLSDLKNNCSYVYLGKVALSLDLEIKKLRFDIPTIWESDIFRLIHPEDLKRKQIEELRFFHFVRQQPRSLLNDYHLESPLRMKAPDGNYRPMLHRIFYGESQDCVRMALCLYGSGSHNVKQTSIVNAVTGERIALDCTDSKGLLSKREIDVLRLVEEGVRSKQIAELLSISQFTVNRHRQNIIEKLQANNSHDACRIAKMLQLL